MGIYIGMGSNVGDRAGQLLLAVRGMSDAGLRVGRLSSIYETAPVGCLAQPSFLNMVAELLASGEESIFTPEQLLARLLRVEYALGRRRDAPGATPGGPRSIDLDLLLYDAERRATPYLTLPHPRLHLRRFVLAPLAELAPALVHPVLGQSVSHLLAATAQDAAGVVLWSPSCQTATS